MIKVTDVQSVTFSNNALITIEEVSGEIQVNGNLVDVGEKDFLITSEKAFDTNETMFITMMDGSVITVFVTDTQDITNAFATSITAEVTTGKSVSYNASEEAYNANVTIKFVLPTEHIKNNDHKYTLKLGDDIIIPESALGVPYYAIDHGQGCESFQYIFVKDSDGKYKIEIEYLQSYLDKVGSDGTIGLNKISFDVLIKETAHTIGDKIHVEVVDQVSIDIPDEVIKYPSNEDKDNNIFVEKSYCGTGTTGDGKTYIDYTVHVSTTKGTKDEVVLKDTLSNLYYKVNGSDQSIAVNSVSVIDTKKDGNTTSAGTFVAGDSNTSFTYTLPKLESGEHSYDVTYRYVLDQKLQETGTAGSEFTMTAGANNSVEATSGSQKISDGDNFYIERSNKPVTINKSGKYNGSDKIEWIVSLSLKEGPHTMVDDMLAEASDISITKEGGGSQGTDWEWTDEKTIKFITDGNYTVTYSTPATPTAYVDQKISNTATVDGKNEATGTVDIPHNNDGTITKNAVNKTRTAVDGNIATFKFDWDVTFALPESGFPAGTVIRDKLSFDKHAVRIYYDTSKHEFTQEQLNALLDQLTSLFGAGVVTPDYNTTTGELVLTFAQDWTNTSGAKSANLKYSTTGYVDLSNINPGLSTTQGNGDTYNNEFSIGNVSATAYFNYRNEVNKIDAQDKSGAPLTSHTLNRTSEGLKWAVVMVLSEDYKTMTIVDTLPAGLTPYEVYVGDEYSNEKYVPSTIGSATFSREGNNYFGDIVDYVKTEADENGKTKVVVEWSIADGENRPEQFQKGKTLYVYIYAKVDEDQFDPVDTKVIEYVNHASVTADGYPIGDAEHTQIATLDNDLLGKAHFTTRWKDYHEIGYVVEINKDGHAVMVDYNGDPIDGASYTFDDVLEFNKVSPDGKEINIMLVPGSVKLEEKVGDDWQAYTGDWAYQYIESKDGDKRYKTISLSGLPDQKILRLKYTYRVDMADTSPDTQYSLGDLKNTATLHGSGDYTKEDSFNEKWEQFDTTASSESTNYLNLSKVDVDNYDKLLPGALFVLEKWNGTAWVALNAISQDNTYVKNVFDTGVAAPAEGITKVYVTVNSSNEKKGTLKIYQPTSDTAVYNGARFENNVCYRVREYHQPDGYMLSDDTEKQPAGYFWFSVDNSTKDEVQWPTDRIRELADDLSKESDTFYLTNAQKASLKVTKKFLGEISLTEAQKKAMTFKVYSGTDTTGTPIAVLTYAQIMQNNNVITTGIEEGKTYTVVEEAMDVAGTAHTVTYSVNGEADISQETDGDVSAAVTINNGIGTVAFTNKYDVPKTSIEVTKEWPDDVPEGIESISFQVYQLAPGATEGSLYVPEGASEAETYTVNYVGSAWETVTVGGLPKYVDRLDTTKGQYSYYVVETDPNGGYQTTYKVGDVEGEAVSAARADDAETIVIVNREVELTVTKKFVDKFGVEASTPGKNSIRFKIYGIVMGGDGNTYEREVVSDTTLEYDSTNKIWHKQGETTEYKTKLAAVVDGTNPVIGYRVEEQDVGNYDVTYYVDGSPVSSSNPIRNDISQVVTIVNGEKVSDGEIIVKKVWDGAEENEKQTVNIELWAKESDSTSTNSKKIKVYYLASYNPNNDFETASYLEIEEGGGVKVTNKSIWDWNNCLFVMNVGDYNPYKTLTVNMDNTVTISGLTKDTIVYLSSNTNDTKNMQVVKAEKEIIDTGKAYRSGTLSANDWTATFENLPYGYTYYIKETNAPAGFTAYYEYTGSDGTKYSGTTAEQGAMTGSLAKGGVIITNRKETPKTGSLKLTKAVTVDYNEPTTADDYALTDGTYEFTITGPDEAVTTVATVYIKVENGVATQYSKDGTTFVALPEDKYAVVSDLAAGDYVITETHVFGMTTAVSGGKAALENSPTNTITVTVTAGEETPSPQATADFTNYVSKTTFNVLKRWMGETGHSVWRPNVDLGTIYFKLYRYNDTQKEKVQVDEHGLDSKALLELKYSDTVWVPVNKLDATGTDNQVALASATGIESEMKDGTLGYYVPYMKHYTNLKALESGWVYIAEECTSTGASLRHSASNQPSDQYWQCSEFTGEYAVDAFKNNVDDIEASKIWTDPSVGGTYTHPKVTFKLYRTEVELAENETSESLGQKITAAKKLSATNPQKAEIFDVDGQLLSGYTLVDTQSIVAGLSETTVTWSNMPCINLANGNRYVYIVVEEIADSAPYVYDGVDNADNTWTFTNKLPTTSLYIKKFWKDAAGNLINETAKTDELPTVTFKIMKVTYTDESRTKIKDGTNATDVTPEKQNTLPVVETTKTTVDGQEVTTTTKNWTRVINDLPKMAYTASGVEYYGYYVEEVSPTTFDVVYRQENEATDTYHTTASEAMADMSKNPDGLEMYNKIKTTSVSATKVWKSGETPMTDWPVDVASVEFTLQASTDGGTTWANANTIVDPLPNSQTVAMTIPRADTAKAAAWSDLPTKVFIPAKVAEGENPAVAAHWADVTYSVVETGVTYTTAGKADLTTAADVADAYGAAYADGKITNIPVTSVAGTKTWNTTLEHTDPILKLTRTYVDSSNESHTETVKGIGEGNRTYDMNGENDLQPVWSGTGDYNRTYTYSGLPQYTANGEKYTYEVAEASFTVKTKNQAGEVINTYRYTVEKGADGKWKVTCTTPEGNPPEFEFREKDNTTNGMDFSNSELTTKTVTKVWETGIENDSNIQSITYELTRTLLKNQSFEVDDNYQRTVTIKKTENGYNVKETNKNGETLKNEDYEGAVKWDYAWEGLELYKYLFIQEAGQASASRDDIGEAGNQKTYSYIVRETGFTYDNVH